MSEEKEIELDLQELKQFFSTSQRKYVQEILKNHINELERKLTEVFFMHVSISYERNS